MRTFLYKEPEFKNRNKSWRIVVVRVAPFEGDYKSERAVRSL